MQANVLKSYAFMELTALAILALLAFCYAEIAGIFSRHMIIHIALMTVAAPALASLLLKRRHSSTQPSSVSTLFAAIAIQTTLLFAWHSPPGIGLAMDGHAGALFMQATLLLSALWFWLAVFNQTGKHLWRGVFALLLTGKLFCLMAILLVFAPRVLYGMSAANMPMTIELADQQFAGLLMVTVCPLTYVLAAVVLICRWFQTLCDSQSDAALSAACPESSSCQNR
ncbi:MAG: cytochrome c oxidase assembly protein [Methylobacter sp.]|uniref:cytochrome c oxidase assembly protein n=1 Tax=Methylobacter sp. TaxID=2051955 RepID=UPI0025DE43A2|nr:cytochrome c oxidase assembly protein [Methylobacter sp.]MCK9619878.1 cytochrome c oxidase assembly protein [Methylobacter sp.]